MKDTLDKDPDTTHPRCDFTGGEEACMETSFGVGVCIYL